MGEYQIFTDATADIAADMMVKMPETNVIPMNVEIGGREYIYGRKGTITAKEFYRLQREGSFATTSQITPSTYFQYFEPCLRGGKDILYLSFSSGMSGTYQSAQLAAEELKKEYPEREIICLDTLCASVGEGFFVREAAQKQSEGFTLEELTEWAENHRLQVCHWFTVDTFEHLRHGGRVSAATAVVGTALQIKPLLHVDDEGCLQVIGKARGRKRAIAMQLSKMEQGWSPEVGKRVLIGHGDAPEAAEILRKEISGKFPEAEIGITDIGPIIGAHTGPGMLAVIYWGNNR